MQISNDKLQKIAAMSDDELKKFISTVAQENGLSLPSISSSDLSGIRALIGGVNAGDPTVTKAVDDISKNIKKNGVKDKKHH